MAGIAPRAGAFGSHGTCTEPAACRAGQARHIAAGLGAGIQIHPACVGEWIWTALALIDLGPLHRIVTGFGFQARHLRHRTRRRGLATHTHASREDFGLLATAGAFHIGHQGSEQRIQFRDEGALGEVVLFELLLRECDLADDCRQCITLGGERSPRGGRGGALPVIWVTMSFTSCTLDRRSSSGRLSFGLDIDFILDAAPRSDMSKKSPACRSARRTHQIVPWEVLRLFQSDLVPQPCSI